MSKPNARRKVLFANKLHREIFLLVFFSAIVPTIITAIAVYFLIFYVTAEQIGIPESIAYNVFPAARRVLGILLIVTPVSIAAFLAFAYKAAHQLVGPFDRIVKELDEVINGAKRDHIVIRKGDKFWPLVARINSLVDQVIRR
ncbi:MAG: hypothetical protein WC552_00490 [Candidatus Omnitrophota bacterium]